MNDFAILINSCDAYSDVWYPFFRILEKTWPEARNHNIYLNTENKKYNDSFFNVKTINFDGKGWGRRLKNCLEEISEDYVLFLLEDFFFEMVDNNKVLDAFTIISTFPNINSISLITTYDASDNTNYFESDSTFVYRKRKAYFVLNASPTFYKKSFLKKYTFNNDSPWYWEFFASIRTWSSKGIHLAKSACSNEIFLYDVKHGGAIHRGKWVGVSTRRILKKNNIEIDLETRGVIEDWLVSNPDTPKHNLISICKNKILFLFNYIIRLFLR